MEKLNQIGIIKVFPLLLVITAVGIISFLLITSTAPFGNTLFGKLFLKPNSRAANSVGRYDVFEVTLTYSTTGLTNPQDQVTILATFTSPSGKQLKQFGFYYDTDTYKVRFKPFELGNYTYTVSMTGGPSGNQSTSGSFSVIDTGRHGPIKVSPTDPYRFVYQDGTNFIPIGWNTSWGATGSTLGPWHHLEAGHVADTIDQYFDSYKQAGFTWFADSLIGDCFNCTVGQVSTSGNTYNFTGAKAIDQIWSYANARDLHGLTTLFDKSVPYSTFETDSNSAAERQAIANMVRYEMARYGPYIDYVNLTRECGGANGGSQQGCPEQWLKDVEAMVKSDSPYSPANNGSTNSPLVNFGYANWASDCSSVSPTWCTDNDWTYMDTRSTDRDIGDLTIATSDGYQTEKYYTGATKGNGSGFSTGKPMIIPELYTPEQSGTPNWGPNWTPRSPVVFRQDAWTSYISGLMLGYWESSYAQGTKTINFYIGPEEKNYVHILSDINAVLPPNPTRFEYTTSGGPTGSYAYGLRTSTSLLIYAHSGWQTNTTAKTQTISGIDVPFSGTAYWVEPSNGLVIGSVSLTQGTSVTITTPTYYEDIALLLLPNSAIPPKPLADATSRPAPLTAPPLPMPVIRTFTWYGSSGTAANSNDTNYSTVWGGTVPGQLSVDMSSLLNSNPNLDFAAGIYNDGATASYDHAFPWLTGSNATGNISNASIDFNAAAGGTLPTTGWTTAYTTSSTYDRSLAIPLNTYNGLMRFFEMTGGGTRHWIRLNVGSIDGSGSIAQVQMDIHEIPERADTTPYGLTDGWLFLGDTPVQDGLKHQTIGSVSSLSQLINSTKSSYYPLMIDGGIGGLTSTLALHGINKWIGQDTGPFVVLQFGYDDASVATPISAQTFHDNLDYMISAVIDAGKIPVLSRPVYSSSLTSTLQGYNSQISTLYSTWGSKLVHGPDLYTAFAPGGACANLLGTDGKTPSTSGYGCMRQQYSNALIANVYNFSSTATLIPSSTPSPSPSPTATPSVSICQGADLDHDGKVFLSDYNIIVSNFNKTGMTASQGDIDGDGKVFLSDYNILVSNFGKTGC